MMKTHTFSLLLLCLMISGCDQSTSSTSKADAKTVALFEKSDDQLSIYLDKLDSPSTSIQERTQIICKDYPAEYTNNYMPNLMKISPQEYTQERLLLDLEAALGYYKDKDKIECP